MQKARRVYEIDIRLLFPGRPGSPCVEPWQQAPLQLARSVALALRGKRSHLGDPPRGGPSGRCHHRLPHLWASHPD